MFVYLTHLPNKANENEEVIMSENQTLNILKARRSCRSYTDKQVPEDVLAQILEAGTYAASGRGVSLGSSLQFKIAKLLLILHV